MRKLLPKFNRQNLYIISGLGVGKERFNIAQCTAYFHYFLCTSM